MRFAGQLAGADDALGTGGAVSAATPLAAYKSTGAMASYVDLFFGNIPGCIGEVSKICILIGAAYLWQDG
ncbi:MAG: RnfABCDGE type electron transport complex subunit D [Christensenellales bacterium]